MKKTEKFRMRKYFINTGTNIYDAPIRGVSQYAVRDCCLLCDAGAETRTHFIAVCSMLEHIRLNYKEQLISILCRKTLLMLLRGQ